jgi:hypothetical protein
VSIDNSSNFPRFAGSPTQIGEWSADLVITDSYSPPELVMGTVKFYVNGEFPRIQSEFPHGVLGSAYSYALTAVGGTHPFHWQVSGLPPGLSADADGNITGTPTTSGIFQNITVTLTDSSKPSPATTNFFGVIRVKPFTGRNDSIATATAATSTTYQASLSPYANAIGIAQPDQDYYKVTIVPGSTLQVTVEPEFPSSIDPVVELVDAAGARVGSCKVPGGTAYTAPCVNDDVDPGVNHTAYVEWQNGSAADRDLYIHVLDWSGNARPDFKYRLRIAGAQ